MKIMNTFALALLASPLVAQDLCEGNGHGEGYINVGPGYLGGYYELDFGSPNAPLSLAILSVSDGFAQSFHPTVGNLCLDVTSGAYNIYGFPTDATGNVHLDVWLPAVTSWIGLPPFYSNSATFEDGAWSLSKTAPLWFENPNSWSLTSPMSQQRILHTMTYLGDDGYDGNIKVLVAGGGTGTVTVPIGTNTTEIFDPLDRTFTPGPTMHFERSAHTATRLPDGKVLILGGMDSNRTVHASGELFDPTNYTFTQIAAMTTPRAGHTATLLDDGRVLVTGGFGDYRYPEVLTWLQALNESQDSMEVYDPGTDSWTSLAETMATARSGHSATKLDDGTVLLVGGISGGSQDTFSGVVAPAHTNTTQLFDPVTETLSDAGTLPVSRAFHGASVLGNGNVLITGGTYPGGSYGESLSTIYCHEWDGTTWHQAAYIPTPTAWHTQITLPSGVALVAGGLEATTSSSTLDAKAFVGYHDGATFTIAEAIGLNIGDPLQPVEDLGGHAACLMHDGAVLLTGGTEGISTEIYDTGYVYTPDI